MPTCLVCKQECKDWLSLARHMLRDTSPQQADHHIMIKKLTWRKEVQLSGKGCLSAIAWASKREARKRLENNSRKKAVNLAKKAGLERKCALCDSLQELRLDHIDHNPLNNCITNLRWLCFPCHATHHSPMRFVGFNTRKDYKRCLSCKKIRICHTFNQVLLCFACDWKLRKIWIAKTNSNYDIIGLQEKPKFRKWIESLSFQS